MPSAPMNNNHLKISRKPLDGILAGLVLEAVQLADQAPHLEGVGLLRGLSMDIGRGKDLMI